MQPLSVRAQGRWAGILPEFGIDRRFLTGKHGPCPICCDGKDRFRFDNKEGRGTFFCSVCGAGDGVDLVLKVTGGTFKEIAPKIEAAMGNVRVIEVKEGRTEDQRRRSLNALWCNSMVVKEDDPVHQYLVNRVGKLEVPACLRFAAKVLYADDVKSWHPAMIALVTSPSGKASTLHRTYLTMHGEKADVASVRRVMDGTYARGSAVRLMAHGPVLGIAEGIETALSASKLFNVPVWAALNSTGLSQWEPPGGVSEVVVFGDNDPKYGGQAAAFALAHKLATLPEGRRVKARVEMPPNPGEDWNDVLRMLDLSYQPIAEKA